MRNKKYHVYLTEEERKLASKALMDERNALIASGRYLTLSLVANLMRYLSQNSRY